MDRYVRLPAGLIVVVALLAIAACGDNEGEARENTLDEILDRGHLVCGIKADTPGFGVLNPDGTAQGNDVEYCHAMAAAVFGDRSKVEFKEATSANRFELLAAKEIDVLIRTTTWTASRDADLYVAFAPTTFYDGAGVMVKASAGLSSAKELDGATICILDGTSTQGAVSDFFSEQGLTYSELTFQANPEIRGAFINDQCDAWSSDKSQLGGHQFTLKGGRDRRHCAPRDALQRTSRSECTRLRLGVGRRGALGSEWHDHRRRAGGHLG